MQIEQMKLRGKQIYKYENEYLISRIKPIIYVVLCTVMYNQTTTGHTQARTKYQ